MLFKMVDYLCPSCGQNKHIAESNFCQKCGEPLSKVCLNENCNKTIPNSANYCPFCRYSPILAALNKNAQ